MRDHYNGLQELEQREDGLNALYQYYMGTKMARNAEPAGILVCAAMEITMLEGNFSPISRSFMALTIDTENFTGAFEMYPELEERAKNETRSASQSAKRK